ncbi:ABC transporter substrate-binding protein [Zafaria sp. Z1313]|uniref:ABC transporter substrate-binding protein n=1 Tax=unclassified Zafaria TaxID=2828765 RepID=UPI002E75CD70|nr:ABC transporter substrate-binding protein [Zafaria sp. J156]MEE1620875.1 ABC transporter substrate-binding protein [Zafaria sp. J156]
MKSTTSAKLAASLMASALLLTACGDGGSDAPGAEGPVEIGIVQYVSHPSLDAAAAGFKRALADAGYEGDAVVFDEQNAQADAATNTSIAGKFASDGKDLVLAIATPSAQAAAQAIVDIPVLFTAVTDPVSADLVDSLEAPGSNLTGTSDLNPVAEQIALIRELAPDAQSVGIVYSSGETNSTVQVELAKEAAAELGLEVKEAAISTSGEVQQAAQSLDVDAFYVPTDNNVVSALESVIQVAETRKVPIVAGEGDSVARGAVATYGINYEQLGYQTGEMAVKILKGEAEPASMAVETQSDLELYVNPGAAERMGVTLPDGFTDQADHVVE